MEKRGERQTERTAGVTIGENWEMMGLVWSVPVSLVPSRYAHFTHHLPLTSLVTSSGSVRSSLKASSHGVNDGWRKRKETTHGESERETDERLDQDMRKDDEEPRAARE